MPESYFPLDVNFFDHPKIVGLSDAALRMYLASIAYSNRLLTDGHVAEAVIGRFVEWDWHDPDAMTPDRCAAELVKAELWHPADVPCPVGTPAGQDGTCPSFPLDGYRIHDFLAHNRSRADRLAARDKERDRKAAYRQRRQTGTDPDNPPPRDGGVPVGQTTGRHRTRDVTGTVNTETETETETEKVNTVVEQARPVGIHPAMVGQVFDAWLTSLPSGTSRKLTPARDKAIQARLREFPLADCLDAARGWTCDPWPDRAQHNDIAILFRPGNFERMRDLARDGPPRQLSKEQRQMYQTHAEMTRWADAMKEPDHDGRRVADPGGPHQRQLPPPAAQG